MPFPPEVDKMRFELGGAKEKLRRFIGRVGDDGSLQKLHFITRSIDSSGARWG